MFDLYRLALGLTVVVATGTVFAVVQPAGSGSREVIPMAAPQHPGDPQASFEDRSPLAVQARFIPPEEWPLLTSTTGAPTPTDQPSTSVTQAGNESTTTGAGEDDHESDDDAHSGHDSTSTTGGNKTPAAAAGDITGKACPCRVTGTAALVGEVSLQGDLVVDGGTLIARPGVSVNGNGFQIVFVGGGKADFQGSKTATWSNRGAKANLKRDINFRNMRRIMFMGSGPSVLKYFRVVDSGTSALGDYPIHFHLNGNRTRGTVVEGVVVENGRNHAFVPHGSHGIKFIDVIAKNTKGVAFWWDDPGTNENCSFQKQCTLDNSNDILYDHVLVDGVSNGPGDSRGFTLAGFNLGAGSGNVIRNSVAVNIRPTHVKDCSGFKWPSDANQNIGGNVWQFKNNYSHSPSGCHGIFVWQNDGNHHVVDGFSGGGIDHGAYANKYEYRNIDVPYLEVHASGWSVTSGRIGTVIAKKHRSDTTPTATFSNVSIDRFVISNAIDGGVIPGHYILNNTGLSCADIEYPDAVPGSTVIIDGKQC